MNGYLQKHAANIQKERADASATTLWITIVALNGARWRNYEIC